MNIRFILTIPYIIYGIYRCQKCYSSQPGSSVWDDHLTTTSNTTSTTIHARCSEANTQSTLLKRNVLRRRTDEEVAEPWVSCDTCGHWVHQICALYCDSFVDATTTSTTHSSGGGGGGGYMCPLCRVEYVAAASVACDKQARKQHAITTSQTNNTNNNTTHTNNNTTSNITTNNKRHNNNDNNDNSTSSISKVQTRRNKRQKLTTEVKSESTINSNKPTTLLDNNTTNTASTTTTNTDTIQCTVSSSSSRSSSEMKVEDGDNEDVCVTATVGDPLTAPAADSTAGATTTVMTTTVGGGGGLNDEMNSLACSTDEETVGPADDHHPREATPTTTTTAYNNSTDINMTTSTTPAAAAATAVAVPMMVEESTQTSDHDSVASYGLATYGTGQLPVVESTLPTYTTTESKHNEQESSTSSHTPQLHTNNTTTTSTNTNTSTSTPPPSTTSSSTTSTPPNHSLNQWSARALPRTKLSDFLEALITERLIEAGYTHITTTLTIRMTSNCPMRLEVPEQILSNMMNTDNSYIQQHLAYKQKCILLFQMIDGVDVCLFCLYIQEFDRYTPAPNNKVRCNIYLYTLYIHIHYVLYIHIHYVIYTTCALYTIVYMN